MDFTPEEMDMFYGTPTDELPPPPPEDEYYDVPEQETAEVVTETFNASSTLVDVFAGLHGVAPEKVARFADNVRGTELVKRAVDEDTWTVVDGFCQLVAQVANSTLESQFNMTYLPHIRGFSERVRALHNAVNNRIGHVSDPYVTFNALVDHLRREQSHRTASTFVHLLRGKANPSELVKAHHAITSPVAAASTATDMEDDTAEAVMARVAGGSTGKKRFSSGLPTLDLAFTPDNCPVGHVGEGEGALYVGASGTGKTSASYVMVVAAVADVINWGFPDGTVVLIHTEEQREDKIRGLRMAPGQPFAHLAKNLIIKDVGSSRSEMVLVLYREVMKADDQAKRTGRPITDFLPRVVFIDYIQSLTGDDDANNPVLALTKTCDLILRGIQEWNPDEMAKHSGVSFEEFAGYPWPEGMDNHLVATVSFAQVKKQDASKSFYDPTKKDENLTKFTLEYTPGDPCAKPWTGPDGVDYCWEVQRGDFRLFGRDEIAGSSTAVNNMTNIAFLHRSKPTPTANPVNPMNPGHLLDPRAVIQIDKARNGTKMKYVPLEFDLQRDGPKAQHYDPFGYQLVQMGKMQVSDLFTKYGDPMTPVRPVRDPFADVSYQSPLTNVTPQSTMEISHN